MSKIGLLVTYSDSSDESDGDGSTVPTIVHPIEGSSDARGREKSLETDKTAQPPQLNDALDQGKSSMFAQSQSPEPLNQQHLVSLPLNSPTKLRAKRKYSSVEVLDRPDLKLGTNSAQYTNSSNQGDDHQGRKRQIPHKEGNWPSFVYLEWTPTKLQLSTLESFVRRAIEKSESQTTSRDPTSNSNQQHCIHTLLRTESPSKSSASSRQAPDHTGNDALPLPLHISLSRPITLVTHRRSEFLRRLTHHLLSNSPVNPFPISFQKDLRWFTNRTRSRAFLSLGVSPPAGNELNILLGAVNAACREMALGELYYSGESEDEDEIKVWDENGEMEPPPKSKPFWSRTSKGDLVNLHPGTDKRFRFEKQAVAKPANAGDKFHVSLAWSLSCPTQAGKAGIGDRKRRSKAVSLFGAGLQPLGHAQERAEINIRGKGVAEDEAAFVEATEAELSILQASFADVKVKIGDTVHSLMLGSSLSLD